MSDAPNEAELQALIDGELTPERRAAVEAAVARDPVLAAHVAQLRHDLATLAAAYGPLVRLAVPPRLLAAARGAPARAPAIRRWSRPLAAASAACLIAAVLLTLTLVRRPQDAVTPGEPAIEEALAARDNTRLPDRELDDDAGLASADQVISTVVGYPARAPDLQRAGFRLVSAEVYGAARANAVQLRYEDGGRRGFTVFLRPPAGPDAFEVAQRGTLRICVWQNADVTAVMIGAMSTPELFRLSSLAYSSLGL